MTRQRWLKHVVNSRVQGRFFTERLKTLGILALVFISIVTMLTLKQNSNKYSYEVGDIAKEEILAPRDIVDTKSTELHKELIASEVEAVEYVDSTIQVDVKKSIEKYFKTLFEVRQTYSDDIQVAQSVYAVIERNNLYRLSKEELGYLVAVNQMMLESVESYIYDIVLQTMANGITYEALDLEKNNIKTYFENLEDFETELQQIAIKIVNNSIKENRFENIELTDKKRLEVLSRLEDVVIYKGTPILKVNDIVTENHIALLKESELFLNKSSGLRTDFVGISIIASILVAYMALYYHTEHIPKKEATKLLSMMAVLFVLIFMSSPVFASFSLFIVPIAVFPMTLSLVSDHRRAIIGCVFLVVIVGLLIDAEIESILVYTLGGIAGAISIRNADQRGAIFISGLMVSAVNMISIIGLSLYLNWELKIAVVNCAYGLAGGVLSSVLTIGMLPLWEYVFRILTPIKLLELSNSNHPLLKKLLMEAPGTYHHSILVGNLSESAAFAIGANPLLARVGSYFHDIGKSKNAYYFKENQLSDDNPHDRLEPLLSAQIIKEHVGIGLELANEYRLPDEIKEIIEQHHGTTLIKYFYHKALNAKDDTIKIGVSSFTYDGRSPRSKEAAIIMMADSVEAAARTLKEHNPETIRMLVRKIINDKLENRQLTYCQLTFNDLEAISEQFSKVLSGVYHERIEYPEIKNKTEEDKWNS